MAIIAKQEGESSFLPMPEGVYTAIAYGLIDIGIQYSEKFDKKARKIIIMWEFPGELIEYEGEQKPRVLSREYTLSLGEKSNLRKDLQAWRGKAFTDTELEGFNMSLILGKACQMQIIHTEKNGKVYANIASIMGMPKGMTAPKGTYDPVCFDMSDPEDAGKINALPTWIQEKIKASESYKTEADTTITDDDAVEDLPF